MVPDKFNMVDMEGIDIITSQGEVAPGLYQKLVESIAQCRYQCLYNWKSDEVNIPPTFVELVVDPDNGNILINNGIYVTSEDVIMPTELLGRQLYTGTFTIDSTNTLMDISVNLPSDPTFVIVVPAFTPTYGVNSTLMYYAVKSLVKVSTNAAVEENNYVMPLGVEGRSNMPTSGYALAYTGYGNVINNIILSSTRIYLPTRTGGYPWPEGEYIWYAG